MNLVKVNKAHIGKPITRREPNQLYVDDEGYLMYLTSGDYTVGGRVSNAWYVQYVDEDGDLGPEENYNYRDFYKYKGPCEVTTKVTINPFAFA